MFHRVIGHWDDENCEQSGRQHAPDYRRPKYSPRNRARTAGDCQGNGAENKSERRHQDRSEANTRPLQSRIQRGLALHAFRSGELDDQNSVLCRKANQHNQADLSVHIILKAPDPKSQKRAKDGDWGKEDGGCSARLPEKMKASRAMRMKNPATQKNGL